MSGSKIKIFSLPSVGQAAPEDSGSSLKEEIEAGLIGTVELDVPGSEPGDTKWAYRRSIPTVTLYDEAGLRSVARCFLQVLKLSRSRLILGRLYDGITANAKEYYLFDDELELLKTHGESIARAMGFPHTEQDDSPRRSPYQVPPKRWRPARWGDTEVGKWNQGVNGEEGLAGGAERGWDVVELGAG